MLSHLILIISLICVFILLRRKEFWEGKVFLKFPAAIFLFVLAISIPPLFGFGTDIHTPYSLFYVMLNYPVMALFNIDEIEFRLFNEHSLISSNRTFAILSIMYWLSVSIVLVVLFFTVIKTKAYNLFPQLTRSPRR